MSTEHLASVDASSSQNDSSSSSKRVLENDYEENEMNVSKKPNVVATQKKKRIDTVALSALPRSELYEKSYCHRSYITQLLWTPSSEYLVSGSVDGIVKLWKKSRFGIEYVKQFRAHSSPIVSIVTSFDGSRLASVGSDGKLNIYDLVSFDLISIISIDFTPSCASFVYNSFSPQRLIAIGSSDTPLITLIDIDRPSSPIVKTVKLHGSPVTTLNYLKDKDIVISSCKRGIIEYWCASSHDLKVAEGILSFSSKLDTDLLKIAKEHSPVMSTALHYSYHAEEKALLCVSLQNRKFFVFSLFTGRLLKAYSDSLETYETEQKNGTLLLEPSDFENRVLREQRLATLYASGGEPLDPAISPGDGRNYLPCGSGAIFDESGEFLLYPCFSGVKVLSLQTSAVVCTLGTLEGHRFVGVALYQGVPKVSVEMQLIQKFSSSNPSNAALIDSAEVDPIIAVAALDSDRFFLFSKRDPAEDDSIDMDTRDVDNEPSYTGVRASADSRQHDTSKLQHARSALAVTLSTSLGEIELQLHRDVPKAVENFVTLCSRGYYDNTTFHRVVKGFCIQGGDPTGSGRGGSSCFGVDFEDEIRDAYKFDRPGILAMANSGGGCSNGSQFFISCATASSLNGKHTIFGYVSKGMDVVKAIENTKVDPKNDRPYDPIFVLSTTVHGEL